MAKTPPKTPINLLRGWPNPSLLPADLVLPAAQKALSTPSIAKDGLLYGPDDGYLPLREEISKWLSEFYDCPDDPNRICITGGASQNLACALQVFTDPGVTKRVWMVAPCYFLACRIFEDAGFAGRLRAVPEDGEGIDVEYLEREMVEVERSENTGTVLKPSRTWSKTYDHIIYGVPNFSNPSGKTMSLHRRQQLVHIARSHNALIITDDVYDHLQWPTIASTDPPPNPKALLPRLTDIDLALPPHATDPGSFHHTLSNASFSKILGPGVRTGFATASASLAHGLSQCGSSRSGGCPSQLVATIIAQLLQAGSLQAHIRDVLVPSYARRYRRMMAAVGSHLVPLGVAVSEVSLEGSRAFGGYFVWVELPAGLSAERVAQLAKAEENLIVAQGNMFEVYGDEGAVTFDQWLRVCFAWEDEELLVEGIARLGRVVKDLLDRGTDAGNGSGKTIESLRTALGGF